MTPLWIVQVCHKNMDNNGSNRYTEVREEPPGDLDDLLAVNRSLQSYFVPFIICVGIVLNILLCVGFTRTLLYKKFFTQIFLAVTVSNLGFLFTLLLTWMWAQGIDIYVVPGMCPMYVFMNHFFPFMSFWNSIAGATILILQRNTISVNRFAHGSSRGKILVICLFVLSFTVYMYKTWTHGIMIIGDRKICSVLQETFKAMRMLNIFDVIFLLLLPFLGFIVFDGIILVRQIHLVCKGGSTTHSSIARDPYKVLIGYSVCFIAFVGPNCLSKVMLSIDGLSDNRPSNRDVVLHNLFQHFFYAYFFLCPIAHIAVSRSFRTHLITLFYRPKRESAIRPISPIEHASEQTLL